jgi:plasmid stabilization system protein ParE
MNYTVGWKPSAEQELARLWTDAADRDAVAAAANRIDAVLGKSPHSQGESRQGRLRILFEGPLAVLFEVTEEDRFVDVLKVWRIW